MLSRAALLPLSLLVSACGAPGASGTQGGGSVVSFAGNLDARAPILSEPFSVADPGTTAQLSAVVQVRGEESGRYPLSFYFRKEEASVFGFYVLADTETSGENSGSAAPGSSSLVRQGTLHFDTDGGLLAATPNEPLKVHFQGAPGPQMIALDFGSAKEEGGDGLTGFTQYALMSSVTYQANHE